MTEQKLDALIVRLRHEQGDPPYCREAADALTALRAERDELRVAIFGSGDYWKTLRNGNFVEMAQATEAGRNGAIDRAEAAEARALAAEAAALERAVAAVSEWWGDWDGKTDPDCVIRALITPAARTALDAALADARRESSDYVATLEDALKFYADENRFGLPSDGPWGLGSTDFGRRAREAITSRVEGGAE
ncbi:MAG: hypothetical protein E6Q97_08250 [Desulfurellales bacterium]|nr:MAG: hypothetical protein E6Q97_08250 [Desulfurellales bacterium]